MDAQDAPRPRTGIERSRDRDGRRAHAKGMLQGIVSMLPPGDVTVDCGANLGAITEVLADSGATVHAFEPEPFTFDILRKNFGDRPNVILHNVAVGVNAGKVTLMRAEGWAANPQGTSESCSIIEGRRRMDTGDGIEVELIDFAFLTDLLSRHSRIALVTSDIESAELDPLEAMETHGFFDKVGLTVAETHEQKFAHLAPRFVALRTRITARYPTRGSILTGSNGSALPQTE